MDQKGIRDIIREVLSEDAAIREVVMKAKQYKGGTWNETLRGPIEMLFDDVGVKQIDAKRDEYGSHIKVLLNNGDSIRGETVTSPISGMVTINGKFKKPLNGREAMMLVTSMRQAWEEYSSQQRRGNAG